jgi:hypothetical protein
MDIWSFAIAWVFAFVLINIIRVLYKSYKESNVIPSYFPENQTRQDYLDALSLDPPANDEKLRQLLFKRAIEAMIRSKLLQEERPSLLSLCRSGALSETILKSFQAAEKETSEEIFEIQADAEMLHEGWSKGILQEAALLLRRQSEVAPNAKLSSTSVNTPSLFGDPSISKKRS